MTRYFAVVFADAAGDIMPPRREDWMPWINCEPAEDLVRLVLHRAVRIRGGVRERVDVGVFETTPKGAEPGKARDASYVSFNLFPS